MVRFLHKGSLFTHRPELWLSLKAGYQQHPLEWRKEHENLETRSLYGSEPFQFNKRFSKPVDLERGRDVVWYQVHRTNETDIDEEWVLLPQELLDNLVLSMERWSESTIAVMGGHIPY
ncbi:hypothetical protein TNCV_468001 [Trichonephila clavipes]|nr:hypothetical protein TNCV_468001 [Trichonephila clavipes]